MDGKGREGTHFFLTTTGVQPVGRA